MDQQKMKELVMNLMHSLTSEQKEKVKACKNLNELTKCLGEMGVALPDELLDAVAGGVTMDEFLCAVFQREWEIEQREHIDMYDFQGQQNAYDRAWNEIANELGMPD